MNSYLLYLLSITADENASFSFDFCKQYAADNGVNPIDDKFWEKSRLGFLKYAEQTDNKVKRYLSVKYNAYIV